MAEPFDPYAVLGVRRGASLAEIARARRSLAKRHHPDSAGADSEEAMRRINLAWEMLAAEQPAVELPPPPWARPPRPQAPPSGDRSHGSHAGWWALMVVGLLLLALFVAVIIGSLDAGAAPDSAPWLRHNLGD